MKLIPYIHRINIYFVVIVLAPLILLSPVILSGKALFWGTPILQFVPWRYLAWESIRAGQLPLWNPYVGMGAPLLANYQSAIFYPLNWFPNLLSLVGGVSWFVWGQTLVVAFHLIWAGLGMAILSRRLGLHGLGQTVSGLAFCLSGYLVSRAGFFSINAAVAWLPWILYYCLPNAGENLPELIFKKQTLKLILVLFLQILAGHAQTLWYSLSFAFIWTTFFAIEMSYSHNIFVENGRNYRNLINRIQDVIFHLSRLTFAVVLAFLLASIQVIPTIEYLANSQRALSVDLNTVMTYSFWPWRLLTLIEPNIFGSPVEGNYWGYGNYWEDALYFGILPFVAFLGCFLQKKKVKIDVIKDHKGRPKQRLFNFLLIMIIISLLIAWGKHAPLFPFLYRYIPTFNMFQAPTRISIWAELSFALIAGFGIEAWRRPTHKGLYWSRLATAGAFAIALGAGLTWVLLGSVPSTFISATTKAGILGGGVGLLYLFAPVNCSGLTLEVTQKNKIYRMNSLWGKIVIGFVMLDLLWFGWGLNPGEKTELFNPNWRANSKIRNMLDVGRVYLPPTDEYELMYSRFMRFDTFRAVKDWSTLRSALLPNVNILDHIRSVNNYDPIVPSRYAIWMDRLSSEGNTYNNIYYERLLNLSGIRIVEKVVSSNEKMESFLWVQNNNRFRWVPCAIFVENSDAAIDYLTQKNIDVNTNVVIETTKVSNNPECNPELASIKYENVQIDLISDQPNILHLIVNAPRSGLLVISDTWYPGWQVSVNGLSKEILHGNYLFRAILLEPGKNDVIFSYFPKSFLYGCFISLLGTFFVATLYLWKKDRVI